MDLYDVRVLQASDGAGLGVEARQGLRAGVSSGENHFKGDEAVEADLAGLVDDAHAPAPQFAEDLVAGDEDRSDMELGTAEEGAFVRVGGRRALVASLVRRRDRRQIDRGLLEAGVSVELHSYPGAFHGSTMAQGSGIANRMMTERLGALKRALGAA